MVKYPQIVDLLNLCKMDKCICCLIFLLHSVSSTINEETEHLGLHLGDKLDFDEEGARHLYEHLSEIIDLPDDFQYGKFSNEQGRFFFFISHDFDRNNKLDGLECLALLTDFYDPKDSKSSGKLVSELSITEVVTLVDELLFKHDLDGDGYIDFAEINNPNVESVWTKMSEVIDVVEKRLEEGHVLTDPHIHHPSEEEETLNLTTKI
ncbi:uncharacterized protein LOC100377831 [Saccoglossus kowalevskii]|uniref:Uncharacterized protein LOC100377831 n=1 Tax=Saccoglossus kowalevskii TaxID=10224 RepID=A0ABM0GTV3_SACKO|nr:PREDICTED: uncharacterized protein LOC100377831 [Saccoglossus kowalevskii]